jgi:hypothetical protein
MPGLVPGIHVLAAYLQKTWIAGTSPAMTKSYYKKPENTGARGSFRSRQNYRLISRELRAD